MKYFEDFNLEDCEISSQEYQVEEATLIAFSKEWDPLPFHIDPEQAKDTPMGQLIAPGVMSASIAVKLLRTMEQVPVAYVAGIGWDEMKFLLPVVAGDRLKIRVTVIFKKLSGNRQERGIVTTFNELLNQDGKVVSSFKLTFMVLTRAGIQPA